MSSSHSSDSFSSSSSSSSESDSETSVTQSNTAQLPATPREGLEKSEFESDSDSEESEIDKIENHDLDSDEEYNPLEVDNAENQSQINEKRNHNLSSDEVYISPKVDNANEQSAPMSGAQPNTLNSVQTPVVHPASKGDKLTIAVTDGTISALEQIIKNENDQEYQLAWKGGEYKSSEYDVDKLQVSMIENFDLYQKFSINSKSRFWSVQKKSPYEEDPSYKMNNLTLYSSAMSTPASILVVPFGSAYQKKEKEYDDPKEFDAPNLNSRNNKLEILNVLEFKQENGSEQFFSDLKQRMGQLFEMFSGRITFDVIHRMKIKLPSYLTKRLKWDTGEKDRSEKASQKNLINALQTLRIYRGDKQYSSSYNLNFLYVRPGYIEKTEEGEELPQYAQVIPKTLALIISEGEYHQEGFRTCLETGFDMQSRLSFKRKVFKSEEKDDTKVDIQDEELIVGRPSRTGGPHEDVFFSDFPKGVYPDDVSKYAILQVIRLPDTVDANDQEFYNLHEDAFVTFKHSYTLNDLQLLSGPLPNKPGHLRNDTSMSIMEKTLLPKDANGKIIYDRTLDNSSLLSQLDNNVKGKYWGLDIPLYFDFFVDRKNGSGKTAVLKFDQSGPQNFSASENMASPNNAVYMLFARPDLLPMAIFGKHYYDPRNDLKPNADKNSQKTLDNQHSDFWRFQPNLGQSQKIAKEFSKRVNTFGYHHAFVLVAEGVTKRDSSGRKNFIKFSMTRSYKPENSNYTIVIDVTTSDKFDSEIFDVNKNQKISTGSFSFKLSEKNAHVRKGVNNPIVYHTDAIRYFVLRYLQNLEKNSSGLLTFIQKTEDQAPRSTAKVITSKGDLMTVAVTTVEPDIQKENADELIKAEKGGEYRTEESKLLSIEQLAVAMNENLKTYQKFSSIAKDRVLSPGHQSVLKTYLDPMSIPANVLVIPFGASVETNAQGIIEIQASEKKKPEIKALIEFEQQKNLNKEELLRKKEAIHKSAYGHVTFDLFHRMKIEIPMSLRSGQLSDEDLLKKLETLWVTRYVPGATEKPEKMDKEDYYFVQSTPVNDDIAIRNVPQVLPLIIEDDNIYNFDYRTCVETGFNMQLLLKRKISVQNTIGKFENIDTELSKVGRPSRSGGTHENVFFSDFPKSEYPADVNNYAILQVLRQKDPQNPKKKIIHEYGFLSFKHTYTLEDLELMQGPLPENPGILEEETPYSGVLPKDPTTGKTIYKRFVDNTKTVGNFWGLNVPLLYSFENEKWVLLKKFDRQGQINFFQTGSNAMNDNPVYMIFAKPNLLTQAIFGKHYDEKEYKDPDEKAFWNYKIPKGQHLELAKQVLNREELKKLVKSMTEEYFKHVTEWDQKAYSIPTYTVDFKLHAHLLNDASEELVVVISFVDTWEQAKDSKYLLLMISITYGSTDTSTSVTSFELGKIQKSYAFTESKIGEFLFLKLEEVQKKCIDGIEIIPF